MLPPGRARLATRPLPTGSGAIANTIGIVEVACFIARPAAPAVTNDIDLKAYKLCRDLGETLAAPVRPAKFDRDGAPLRPKSDGIFWNHRKMYRHRYRQFCRLQESNRDCPRTQAECFRQQFNGL